MKSIAHRRPILTFMYYTAAAAVLCGLLAAYFGIRYGGIDDAVIANIASGAFGTADSYFLLIGYPLSVLISILRAVLPSGINWYAVFSLFMICVSLGVIGLGLHRHFGFLRGSVLWAACSLLCASQAIIAMNRIKTAAVILAAGVLLLRASFTSAKRYIVPAAMLWATGAMYSKEAVAVAAVVFIPLFISVMLQGGRRLRTVLGTLACIVLCALFIGVDAFEYSGTYAQHREYTALCQSLARKDITYGEVSALGFSEADVALIKSGDFNDSNYFTLAKLNAANDIAVSHTFNETLSDLGASLNDFGTLHTLIFVFLCSLPVLFFGNRRNRMFFVLSAILAAACILIMARLNMLGAQYLLAVLLPFSALALMLAPGDYLDNRQAAIAACICAVIAVPLMFEMHTINRSYIATQSENDAAWAEIFADNKQLYVLSSSCTARALGTNVFAPRPSGAFINVVFLGGVPARTVFEDEVLADYGYDTPWQAVFDGAPLLIDGDSDVYTQYVKSQSNLKRFNKIDTVPVDIYKIS